MQAKLVRRLAAVHLLLAVCAIVALVATGAGSSAIIIAAVAFGAAALLTGAIALGSLRPLDQVVETARGFARGDTAHRIDSRAAADIGELADAFNEMADGFGGFLAAASRERSRLVAALNSSTDAVVAVAGEGRVVFANVAAERLFMRSHDELVGNPFVWTLPNEQVLAAMRASCQHGRRETCIIERSGRHYLQVAATPIVDGGEWAALLVFHDLTDMKRTEQMRRDFIANVSHELRTPLASIKSVIETLAGGAISEEEVARDFLARADSEIDRLVQMVEELLELSRIESGEVPFVSNPVDLAAVLRRAAERIRPQAARRGLHLEVTTEPGLPPVIGDGARLERAVMNLLHNAIKFTPGGGSIDVTAGLVDGAVTITIRDTGVGIADEDLPRIFERFYMGDRARQGGGTGLGLALVKHAAEAHHGTITVWSREGEGSVFTLSLPAAALPLPR